MNCPVCKSGQVRRSRRQSLMDHTFSVLGVYPWRCMSCESRYYARLMTLNDSLRAHCSICGNHELKRIDREHVNTPLAFLGRWLSLPAYRCEPCRKKFFSVRPFRPQPDRDRELVEVGSPD